MAYDLLIRNGRIVDGSGMPAVRGDVAVKDGKIAGLILVSPSDFLFLDFLAGVRIVRSKCDPGCGANSFRIILDVIRSEARNRSVGDIWSSDLVREISRFVDRSRSPNLI